MDGVRGWFWAGVLAALVSVTTPAAAATVTWTGLGQTQNWSEGANWAGEAVPGEGDAAVFDATGAADCVIDQDVIVKSVLIQDDYAGTLRMGSATITLRDGDFRTAASHDGHYDRGTSTIRFEGTADQFLYYRDRYYFHNIVNAKTGGLLTLTDQTYTFGWNVQIYAYTGLAGSRVRFGGMTASLGHLKLLGEDGNLARVDHGLFIINHSEEVRYAYLKGVDCSFWSDAMPIDATDHCVDGGGNKGVYFDHYLTWTGAGADDEWSTPANWSGDRVPAATDTVAFTGGDGDCSLDTDATVAGLLVYKGYAGTLHLGSQTLTLAGDRFSIATEATGALDAGTSHMVFSPASSLRLQFPNGTAFHNVTLREGKTRIINGFAAAGLTLEPGVEVDWPGVDVETPSSPMKRIVADTIDWQGTAAQPIKMQPVIDLMDEGYRTNYLYGLWFLDVATSATVSHVHVLGCNADGGLAIDGADDCIDRGRNANWSFPRTAFIQLPAASPVSPLCIEGWRQDGLGALTVSAGSQSVPVTLLGENLWYGNAPLDPAGPVTLAVHAGGSELTSAAVTWTATDLAALDSLTDEVLLRPGDQLKLTATHAAGTTLEIDTHGTGSYTVVTDHLVATYEATGPCTARARVDGVEVGSLSVRVVDVDLPETDPIPIQIGKTIKENIPVLGGNADMVEFTPSSPDELSITRQTDGTKATVSFHLAPEIRGAVYLVCRLRDAGGPIVRVKALNTFTLTIGPATHFPILKVYPDGDRLAGGKVTMKPAYPGLKVLLSIATGGSLFEETGTNEMWVRTSDFTPHGEQNYYIVTSSTRIVCHGAGVAVDE